MDYKEDKLTAKQRANYVGITNELGVIPSIVFVEEITTLMGTECISKVPMGQVGESLSDSTVEFPLLNPDTNEVIGHATYLDTYTNLYSLYRFLADRRDLAAQPLVES